MNRLDAHARTLAHPPLPETAQSQARGRILVAEDQEPILRAVARLLRESGFEVQTASNGKLAVEALRHGQFDVVLSDISMPEMNGIELLRAVREHDLDIPVVIMTGDPTLHTALPAIEHGAMRYLVKPVRGAELLPVVTQATRLCRMARSARQALMLLGDSEKFVGERIGLDLCLSRALPCIWMAFQPIVEWSTRRVHAHEMLLRTDDAHLRSAGAMLQAAERTERLPELGRAVRRAVAVAAEELPRSRLFMNVHARDLEDEDLYSPSAPLSRCADRIVLEITERASLDDIADVERRIQALRALGYQIALDDLGAGYAGLASLARLEPDVVKLDMSLIRGLDRDTARQKLVGAMVRLATEMGKQVVIEGVETSAERDTLVGLGGDLFQGYLFAKPERCMPAVAW